MKTWDELYEEQRTAPNSVVPLPADLPPCTQCNRTTHYRQVRVWNGNDSGPVTRDPQKLYDTTGLQGFCQNMEITLRCACGFTVGHLWADNGAVAIFVYPRDAQ